MERRAGFVVGYRTWVWHENEPDDLTGVVHRHPWSKNGEATVAQCGDGPVCRSTLGGNRNIKAQTLVRIRGREAIVIVEHDDKRLERAFPLPVFPSTRRGRDMQARFVRSIAKAVVEELSRGHLRIEYYAPTMECQCGLHGWFDLDNCVHYETSQETRPTGAILAWGKMAMYPGQGFRAQFARPIALVRSSHHAAERLSRAYNVPLLDRSEMGLFVTDKAVLEAYAGEFAERPPEATEGPTDKQVEW